MNDVATNILTFSILVMCIAATSASIAGQDMAVAEEASVPDWVRTVFEFWTDGAISDSELIGALEFLIGAGIIDTGDNYRISDLERQVQGLENQLAQGGGMVEDDGDFT